MQSRFEDKVIAMGGGSGGIGSCISQRLASEGAIVAIGDANLKAAEQTAAEIRASGGQATPHLLDIGDEASVASFVRTVADTYGGLDGFHVNACDSARMPLDIDLTTMAMDEYDLMMRTNLRGYMLCTRHAVPELLKRGGGCMLYTSSAAAYIGEPVRPAYAMAKNSIHALSRHVASRWGKQGVRSNVIAPGVILHAGVVAAMGLDYADEILAGLRVTRVGAPEDIAAMAALLLSDEGGFITGQVINVDGGATMRP